MLYSGTDELALEMLLVRIHRTGVCFFRDLPSGKNGNVTVTGYADSTGTMDQAGIGISALTIPGLAILSTSKTEGESTMAHELPALPYEYNALEPFLDEETLHLHHDKHHAAYVTGLNAAEAKVQAMLQAGDYANARAVAGDLAFHGSGHTMHSIFWTNMKPGGGGEPTGELAEKIVKQFGSYEAFKGLFIATTNAVQGSGWGVLGYRKCDDALVVLGAEKHENASQAGIKPILVLDVWEHAYYLKYQNKRPEWTKVFMENLVNWDDVAKRLCEAKG